VCGRYRFTVLQSVLVLCQIRINLWCGGV
jgi:hypothetical protein